MNPGAPGFFVWIYGGRECRCGQGFREGNGKLVRQRDVASIRGERWTPEGEDIGSGCCRGGVIQLRSRERALLRQGQLFEPASQRRVLALPQWF